MVLLGLGGHLVGVNELRLVVWLQQIQVQVAGLLQHHLSLLDFDLVARVVQLLLLALGILGGRVVELNELLVRRVVDG